MTTPAQQIRRTRRLGWIVLAVAVVLAAVLTVQSWQRQRWVTCQSDLMSQLHKDLYAELGKAADRPDVWGPAWVSAFDRWESEMDARCPMHDHE